MKRNKAIKNILTGGFFSLLFLVTIWAGRAESPEALALIENKTAFVIDGLYIAESGTSQWRGYSFAAAPFGPGQTRKIKIDPPAAQCDLLLVSSQGEERKYLKVNLLTFSHVKLYEDEALLSE